LAGLQRDKPTSVYPEDTRDSREQGPWELTELTEGNGEAVVNLNYNLGSLRCHLLDLSAFFLQRRAKFSEGNR